MSKRVAVILGAGSGNGLAFAQKFLSEGFSVAVCSRSQDAVTKMAESLGPMARGYRCDVTSDEDVKTAFQNIENDLGLVHTLIYNAGPGGFKPFDQWTATEILEHTNVNAGGLFRAAQTVEPHMTSLGGGNIVVVGAGAATRGRPMTTGFAAGKAAQRSVAQSLARAWWPKKIHVSYMIIDGVIDGPIARQFVKDQPDDFFLNSDHIAEAIWSVVNQKQSAWTFEFDVRPFGEKW